MDVTMLPMVWPGTSVGEALDLLNQRGRAGVVMQNVDDTYRLLHAGDLLRARAKQVGTIGQINAGRPVLLLDDTKAKQFNLDLVRPVRTADAYEKMLAAHDMDYAL